MTLTRMIFNSLLVLAFAVPAFGQSPLTLEGTSNGITQHWTAGAQISRGQIVKLNSASQVIPMSTTDTGGALGVAVTSASNAGADLIVSLGGTPLIQLDGTCAIGNVVLISSTSTGLGHCSASASGQTVGVAISASSPGSSFWNVQLSPLSSAGAGGGGGISSPTSLPIFFSGYTGVSPKDCSTSSCNTPGIGAQGDWHSFFDCTINTGSTTVNCTNPHFTSTAVDGGKAAEWACSSPSAQVSTIATVVSGTQATVTANSCAINNVNGLFAFGTDDTIPLRNWAAFISAAFSSTSTTPSVRGGYLPRGQYYTTKAVRFVYSGATIPTLNTTTGECTKISGGTIWCPLNLTGDGTWASTIIGATNFAWNADGTSANTALCYVNNWSGSYIANMGCAWAQGQESGFTLNTTGQTGLIGTWLFDNNQHTKWDSNFAYGCHNTTNTCPGLAIDRDFESAYQNSAVEFSDINLFLNSSKTAHTYEKIVFDTLFAEGGGGAQGNIQIGDSATLQQVTFRNVHSRDGTASINIRPGIVTTNNDALVFDRFRQTTNAAAANQGVVVQSAIKMEFNNPYIEDTGGTAAGVLFTITQGANISLYGGALKGNAFTNCISATGGTPSVYAYGTQFTGCTNRTTGTGNFNFLVPTTTGWTGPGGVEGTYFLSDQGTAAANGQVALSAGWGTTATVTAAAGFNQHARFTLTSSGTGQAANPTITWTLPNALPTATVLCTMEMTGGTGANTLISQTTLSATAPVFTFNGTPVAASTYIVDVTCGP